MPNINKGGIKDLLTLKMSDKWLWQLCLLIDLEKVGRLVILVHWGSSSCLNNKYDFNFFCTDMDILTSNNAGKSILATQWVQATTCLLRNSSSNIQINLVHLNLVTQLWYPQKSQRQFALIWLPEICQFSLFECQWVCRLMTLDDRCGHDHYIWNPCHLCFTFISTFVFPVFELGSDFIIGTRFMMCWPILPM